MAKRKRKKSKKALLGSVLKYEIYGIILITLSVIALSGEAAVGRSLSAMSAYVFGRFYFVLPLIGIYLGLSVMIHRKWPTKWGSRHTGLLLLVLSLTLMSTIYAMELKLAPQGLLTPGNVFSQIHNDLNGALAPGANGSTAVYLLGKDISGGYAGALQFVVLLWLFGTLGAKLLMAVMMAISFMLVTNLSYVELFALLRNQVKKLAQEMRHVSAKRPRAVPVKSKATAGTKRLNPEPVQTFDEEEEEPEESIHTEHTGSAAIGGASLIRKLTALIGGGRPRKEDGYDGGEEQPESPYGTSGGSEIQGQPSDIRHTPGHEEEWNMPHETEGKADEAVAPIIRDFFEHIRSEGIHEEDREDWTGFSPAARAAVSGTTAKPDMEEEGGGLEPSAETGSHSGMDTEWTDGEPASEVMPVPVAAPPVPKPKPYKLPPYRLLSKPSGAGKGGEQSDYMQIARKLEATLESFGVRARVLEVVRGPAVTRYEIQPDIGVKVSRIVNLTDDIALALAAKDIRMEAPIPGKSAIGIEVPNSEVSVVTMREVMETAVFTEAESKLSIAFGRDISGQTIIGNLARMPHLLVAGATGSGKSVCINGIITSILYKAKPDEVKFLMVDPKMVELNVYNGIPHLMAPVVTDPKRASMALKKIVVEMEKRYELFSKSGTRNIEGYNKLMQDNLPAVLPYIVVIVDELADLMMVAAGDVEDAIARLAQMARAAGIHLIIATQRPSVDVITGVIKANIPSRIAFGVSSQVDSRTILDMGGAEKLLGRGDMLFMPMGASKPIRVQGAFMSDQEVETIVHYVRSQGEAEYDESIVPELDDASMAEEEPQDELYEQAVQIVLEAKQASVSLLQRRMRVGYTRAARLIDYMEGRGVIGPYEGSKPREVLMSLEQYQHNNNKITS